MTWLLVRARQRADLGRSECLDIGLDDPGHAVSLEEGREHLGWSLGAGGLFEGRDGLDGLVHLLAGHAASLLVGGVVAIEGVDVAGSGGLYDRLGGCLDAVVALDGVHTRLLDAAELSLGVPEGLVGGLEPSSLLGPVHASRELVRLLNMVEGFRGETDAVAAGSLLVLVDAGGKAWQGSGLRELSVERLLCLDDGRGGDVGRLHVVGESAHGFGAIAADEREVA